MTPSLTRADVQARLSDLPGWVLLVDRLHPAYDGTDPDTARRVATAVLGVGDTLPEVHVRNGVVGVRTISTGHVTTADLAVATAIEAAASSVGGVHVPVTTSYTDLGIDTADDMRIAPFWAAVLGYEWTGDPDALNDPFGTRLGVWFQVTDGAATGRNRPHVDVSVLPERAESRVRAVIEAGGRLVTDEFAPRWWVLADADGNEACVCTEEGRGL